MKHQWSQPVRLAGIVVAALALSLATASSAREITQNGVPGPDGAPGKAGDPGTSGSPGYSGKIAPAVAGAAEPKNVAVADGRTGDGGKGGSGGPGSPEGEDDEDADGGNGADGGSVSSATADAVTDWTQGLYAGDPVHAEAHSEAFGGDGGDGGGPGIAAGNGKDGEGGSGGAGASANAGAKAANLEHRSTATARAEGGGGGGAVRDGNGGRGGGANAVADASSTGQGHVVARSRAKGGGGGGVGGIGKTNSAGLGGPGGDATASAFAEGMDGKIQAEAQSQGGSGGSGGGAGSAGSASANARALARGSGSVQAKARSTGGQGGAGLVKGGSGGMASASATAISLGGGDAKADANAGGGTGPGGGASIALHNAAVVSTTGAASLRQTARGGSGRDGSSGGDARSSVEFAHRGNERLNVNLTANAGGGGSGGDAETEAEILTNGPVVIDATARGGSGGTGGKAKPGPLFAESTLGEDVTIRARGAAGSGTRPAKIELDNLVGGATTGRLRLEQYAVGGNSTMTRGGRGAEASNRLHRQHAGERLYLLAESKGGDGRKIGGGAAAAVDIAGQNDEGELIIRAEALGGAGGDGNLGGNGGAANMQARGVAPAGAGSIDIRVQATGGPGAQGETTLTAEQEARVAEARGDGIDIAERFGAGGDATGEVRAESLSRENVRVENDIRGGSAPPQGLFPANGGEARSRTEVEAPESGRVQVAANTYGGDARLSGEAGPASARLIASAGERLEARAAASAGAGGEFADANAHVQGAGNDGRLTARAVTRLHEQAGPMNALVAEISLVPRGRLPSDPSTAGRSRLVGIQALAGPAAADDQSEDLPRHAVAGLVPYPAGEPDSLFAMSLTAKHPVSAGMAKRLREMNDPAARAAAETLSVSAVFHWPEALPTYSIRGTGLELDGEGTPVITVTGLHDDSDLGSLTIGDGAPEHSAESIFRGAWNPQRRLVSGTAQAEPLNGIRIEVRLEPGQSLGGRLLVVR